MISTSSAIMKYNIITPPKRPRNLFTGDLSELGMVLLRLFNQLSVTQVIRIARGWSQRPRVARDSFARTRRGEQGKRSRQRRGSWESLSLEITCHEFAGRDMIAIMSNELGSLLQ